MLVSVASSKAGGRGGPSNYTDIPPGPLTACHMADLYIHPNSPVALRVVGRDLSAWLERAVSLFFQVKPGAQDARLINPDFSAYNFDMIHGLTFGVDLSQPARFDARGHVANPGAKRIVGLRHEGVTVDDDQPFIAPETRFECRAELRPEVALRLKVDRRVQAARPFGHGVVVGSR